MREEKHSSIFWTSSLHSLMLLPDFPTGDGAATLQMMWSIPMSRMSGCSGHLKSSRRPVNVLVGLKKDILNSSSLSLLITFPTTQSLSYSTATKSSSDKSCGVTFLFSEFCLIVLDFVGAFSLQCKLNYHSEYIHCIVDCNPSRLRRIFSYIFYPY